MNLLDKEKISVKKLNNTANQNNSVINNYFLILERVFSINYYYFIAFSLHHLSVFWFFIHALPAFPPLLPAYFLTSRLIRVNLNSNGTDPLYLVPNLMKRCKYWPDPLLCRHGFSFNGAARLFTLYSLSYANFTYTTSLVRQIYFLSLLHLFMHYLHILSSLSSLRVEVKRWSGFIFRYVYSTPTIFFIPLN